MPRNVFENHDVPLEIGEETAEDQLFDDFPVDAYQEARKDLLRDLERQQLEQGHSVTRAEQIETLKKAISEAGG
jgi:hypothetical protein